MASHTCAILLSRQPLRPTRDTAWVRKAVQAVCWAAKRGLRVYTSTGISTWEMLIAIARRESVPQTVIIAASDETEFEAKRRESIEQFDLGRSDVEFVALVESGRNRRQLMQARDRHIISSAEALIPVSLRSGGRMNGLVESRLKDGVRVIRRYAVDYEPRTEPLQLTVDSTDVNPALARLADRYVIHWTRGSNGPWPTEKRIYYYNAVLDHRMYPRDGFATLCNILACRRICASMRHMPDRMPTVSFSDAPPGHFAGLMRWRARYREMSFEPYGIGIDKSTPWAHGIRRVVYQSGRASETSVVEPWLAQSEGARANWRVEREWRHKGDFDFGSVPDSALCCFCHTQREARRIRKDHGIRALAFRRT